MVRKASKQDFTAFLDEGGGQSEPEPSNNEQNDGESPDGGQSEPQQQNALDSTTQALQEGNQGLQQVEGVLKEINKLLDQDIVQTFMGGQSTQRKMNQARQRREPPQREPKNNVETGKDLQDDAQPPQRRKSKKKDEDNAEIDAEAKSKVLYKLCLVSLSDIVEHKGQDTTIQELLDDLTVESGEEKFRDKVEEVLEQ